MRSGLITYFPTADNYQQGKRIDDPGRVLVISSHVPEGSEVSFDSPTASRHKIRNGARIVPDAGFSRFYLFSYAAQPIQVRYTVFETIDGMLTMPFMDDRDVVRGNSHMRDTSTAASSGRASS